MTGTSKKEADAYDRILEAAEKLSELIELSGIEIDEYALEELTIYLAHNAPRIKDILEPIRRAQRPMNSIQDQQ